LGFGFELVTLGSPGPLLTTIRQTKGAYGFIAPGEQGCQKKLTPAVGGMQTLQWEHGMTLAMVDT
jgi:hypothetical protein